MCNIHGFEDVQSRIFALHEHFALDVFTARSAYNSRSHSDACTWDRGYAADETTKKHDCRLRKQEFIMKILSLESKVVRGGDRRLFISAVLSPVAHRHGKRSSNSWLHPRSLGSVHTFSITKESTWVSGRRLHNPLLAILYPIY